MVFDFVLGQMGARRLTSTIIVSLGCTFLFLLQACKNDIHETRDNVWCWVGGSDAIYQAGTYGSLDVSAANSVPGSRYGAMHWIDSAGGFWLFGGLGYDSRSIPGYLNDLWRYTPATAQWTWVSGSDTVDQTGVHRAKSGDAAIIVPGARSSSASWRDSAGNLWLFGGVGHASGGRAGYLNDLWKFSPANRKWTLIETLGGTGNAGAYGTKGVGAVANLPGARSGSVSWVDTTGNFWLFGGRGHDGAGRIGYLNDLWKFNPSTGLWTWVSGGDVINQLGIYDSTSTGIIAAVPGGREGSVGWIDGYENLWLFGGLGADGADGTHRFNDLWKFVPATGLWTLVTGGGASNQTGIYGTKGVATAATIPSARDNSSGWVDSTGNFWLFGGYGYVEAEEAWITGYLNDLWKFSPVTGRWTWVSGNNNFLGPVGPYSATSGVAGVPGGRYGFAAWTDGAGERWVFGGYGKGAAGQPGYLNDLWKFAGICAVPSKPTTH